eukprot:COSAG05_NODE_793_length_7295_cov_2.666481_5_plen_144_part_00
MVAPHDGQGRCNATPHSPHVVQWLSFRLPQDRQHRTADAATAGACGGGGGCMGAKGTYSDQSIVPWIYISEIDPIAYQDISKSSHCRCFEYSRMYPRECLCSGHYSNGGREEGTVAAAATRLMPTSVPPAIATVIAAPSESGV